MALATTTHHYIVGHVWWNGRENDIKPTNVAPTAPSSQRTDGMCAISSATIGLCTCISMTWVRISRSRCDLNIHVHCNSQYHPRCCPPAPPSFHRAVQLLYTTATKWTQSRLHKSYSNHVPNASPTIWEVSTTLLFVLHEKSQPSQTNRVSAGVRATLRVSFIGKKTTRIKFTHKISNAHATAKSCKQSHISNRTRLLSVSNYFI